jgi:hypothetical protein
MGCILLAWIRGNHLSLQARPYRRHGDGPSLATVDAVGRTRADRRVLSAGSSDEQIGAPSYARGTHWLLIPARVAVSVFDRMLQQRAP